MGVKDWALIVGMAVQLIVVIRVAWSIGKWQGEVNSMICEILKRLDIFEKRYGDLPERVAKLEGYQEGREDK